MCSIGAFPKLGTLATGPQASYAREAEETAQINNIDIRVLARTEKASAIPVPFFYLPSNWPFDSKGTDTKIINLQVNFTRQNRKFTQKTDQNGTQLTYLIDSLLYIE